MAEIITAQEARQQSTRISGGQPFEFITLEQAQQAIDDRFLKLAAWITETRLSTSTFAIIGMVYDIETRREMLTDPARDVLNFRCYSGDGEHLFATVVVDTLLNHRFINFHRSA